LKNIKAEHFLDHQTKILSLEVDRTRPQIDDRFDCNDLNLFVLLELKNDFINVLGCFCSDLAVSVIAELESDRKNVLKDKVR